MTSMKPSSTILRTIGAACLLCVAVVGCGTAKPEVDLVDAVRGKVLLPTGKPLKGGIVVLRPTAAIAGVAQPVTAEVDSDGSFVIEGGDADKKLAAGEYKVFVNLSSNPKHRSLQRQVPEKYQSIGDDDSDLIIDLAEQAEGFVLKMNKNKI